MSLAGPNRKPALTAAASKIGYSRLSAGKLRDEPWQDRAWDVYDKLGPVYYMTRYRSAVARKIDYFAAKKDSPGADPDNDVTYNDEGEIISEGPATKALEVEGGPELIRRIVSELMVHWDVAGEAYLVRFEEAPFWRILSTQELRTHTGGYAWMDDDIVKEVIDRDNVFRVWKPHPRNHWQADSPTRHVLEDAEGLILSGREIRARSQSRLSAGLWMIPDTVDFTPFGEDESGTEDDFARQLTAHLARPLSDPGSAASLVPWIVTMDRTDIPIAKEGFIDFARDWDISIELREEQLNHVALGIDMPPELATGTAGSMNHWGSWWLTDEAVNMHVLPTVDDILDSLSINWFRPLLTVDPASYVIWRDPSPATVQADQSDVAARAYELGAISGKAYRRAINMDEEDAPDPEELAERAALKAPATEDTIEQAPPIRGSGDSPLPGAAVTAAVRRRIVATELADLDAELLAWVQEQADKEIQRLFNLALTAADPLDESLLTSFAQKLERKIAQAQAAARAWLTRITGRTPSSDGEDLALSQGVQTIIAGTLAAARRKLFTPDASPDPIDTGRMPNITTPTEAIRHGLSLAGGGPAVYEGGKTAELIGNGQKVHDELEGDGFFQDGYVWKYGHPANSFEPHLRLAGTVFESWDDPKLAVQFGDSWLRRSHYAPGDHKGCCCAFVQVIVEALEQNQMTPEEMIAEHNAGMEEVRKKIAARRSAFVEPVAREATSGSFAAAAQRLIDKAPKTHKRLISEAAAEVDRILATVPEPMRARYVTLMDRMENFKVTTTSVRKTGMQAGAFKSSPFGIRTGAYPELSLETRTFNPEWSRWNVAKQRLGDAAGPEPDFFITRSSEDMANVMLHEMTHAHDWWDKFDANPARVNARSNRLTRWVDEGFDNRFRQLKVDNPEFAYGASAPGEGIAEATRMYLGGLEGRPTLTGWTGKMTAHEWREAYPDLARAVEDIIWGLE